MMERRPPRLRSASAWLTLVLGVLVGLAASPAAAHSTIRPALTQQDNGDPLPESVDESVPAEDGTEEPEEEPVPDGFVEISSIPVVPNVEVEIDGEVGVTDAEGKVLIPVEETRQVHERIQVNSRFVDLGRGWEAAWQRNYRIGDRRYALAFSRYMPVSFGFNGSNGEVIDREDIDSLTLKSSLGEVIEDVPLDRPIVLHGDRVVSTQRGPEIREVEWSVERVIVRDTNVVNRAQIRFTPSTVDFVDVPLLFFAADFSVFDMFFRSPVLGQIELTLPNGDVEIHDLDEEGRLHLESMPRGEYKVLVLGPGPNIARPVVLSRNQTLDLQFLSWLDITVVGVSLLLFLTIPLIVGRRFIRRRSRRKARLILDRETSDRAYEPDVVEIGHLPGESSIPAVTADVSHPGAVDAPDVVEDGDDLDITVAATRTNEFPGTELLDGPPPTPAKGQGPLAYLLSLRQLMNGWSPPPVDVADSGPDENRVAVDAEIAALDSVGDVEAGDQDEQLAEDTGFTIVSRNGADDVEGDVAADDEADVGADVEGDEADVGDDVERDEAVVAGDVESDVGADDEADVADDVERDEADVADDVESDVGADDEADVGVEDDAGESDGMSGQAARTKHLSWMEQYVCATPGRPDDTVSEHVKANGSSDGNPAPEDDEPAPADPSAGIGDVDAAAGSAEDDRSTQAELPAGEGEFMQADDSAVGDGFGQDEDTGAGVVSLIRTVVRRK